MLGLFAVDFNEDHEPYVYLVAGLISRGVPILVSRGAINDWEHTDKDWPKGNVVYRKLMEKRIEQAKKTYPKNE
jgi:hypothetical protein